MRLPKSVRIILGIIAVILACLSCVEILCFWFFVPISVGMTVLQEVESNVLYSLLFIAIAAGFAFLARWCFTGRGLKQRS